MSKFAYRPLNARIALAPPRPGLIGRIAAAAIQAWRAHAKDAAERRVAEETVRSLVAMNNRDLKDMGISRSEILSLVYGPSDDRRIVYRREP